MGCWESGKVKPVIKNEVVRFGKVKPVIKNEVVRFKSTVMAVIAAVHVLSIAGSHDLLFYLLNI